MFSSLYNNSFGPSADLKKITEKYPYFSVAHFFLLQQTAAAEESYAAIAAKTALHFANPYLLQYHLHAEAITPEMNAPQAEETVHDKPGDAIPADNNFDHRVEVTEDPAPEPNEATSSREAVETAVTETNAETMNPEEKKQEEAMPLLFEPLHTTDYFASQGIRLSEVIQPGDKMGRQLKSFTEWLKTMKKVHPDGSRAKADESIDPSVQNLAEKSNKEEDIITESMATVYLQQGKTNKAREIYEKLSLLNPSKSAYFAAKLNEIQ